MSPAVRTLYQASGFAVSSFECRPGDPAWSQENVVCDRYHVVFPMTPVRIVHPGHRPVVANRNHAMFYNGRQVYRRELMSDEGDRCLFIEVDPAALRECAEAWGLPLGSEARPMLPFADGPLGGASYLRQSLLARYLATTTLPDHVLVQETVLNLVGRAARDAFAIRDVPVRRTRRSTVDARADIVEHAKQILTTRFREAIGLDTIAHAVHTSPFHLARIFRARTGSSLHRYRNELRLRDALDRAEAADDLTVLALDLGYGSHSHFSQAFRRAFGMAPSSFRSTARQVSRRTLSELAAAGREPAV